MIIDKALEIEDKFRLTEAEFEGFRYWVFCRTKIYTTIQTQMEWEGYPHYLSEESFAKKVSLFFRRLVTLLNPRYYKAKQCSILFASPGRKVLRNGLYIDTYVDPIIKMYPESILFEYSFAGKHFRPTKLSSIYYSDRYGALSEAKGFIYRLTKCREYKRAYDHITQTLAKPLQELCNIYGVVINWNPVLDEIVTYYFIYHSLKKSYMRFLNRTQPKALIVVCYYARQNMIFIELCKEKGIPTIELQHGTCGVDHFAYNFPKGSRIKQFPDYYLSFSDYWSRRARFPIPSDHIISVGFPYGESRLMELKKIVYQDKIKIILFLSQATLGKQFSEIACQLYEMLDPEEYRIIFKMHPSEFSGWKSRYKKLAQSSIEVANQDSADLYALFARAYCIVGVGSTTAMYEGMMFNIPAYVYSKSLTREFIEMCDNGIVGCFKDANDLKELILKEKILPSPDLLWKKNALLTMRETIDQILEGFC